MRPEGLGWSQAVGHPERRLSAARLNPAIPSNRWCVVAAQTSGHPAYGCVASSLLCAFAGAGKKKNSQHSKQPRGAAKQAQPSWLGRGERVESRILPRQIDEIG